LWLKNKAEINLFENLHSFKVAEASDLISWLDFLLDNLFLCFGQGVYRECIGIPMFFLSSLVWFFLWLPEEVLTLLFLLHCENGNFSILMKDTFT
jgi:hypothetical protein